jgi:hypothetical protein
MKKDYAGNIIRIEIGSNRCVYARVVPGIATIIEVLNFVDIVDLTAYKMLIIILF